MLEIKTSLRSLRRAPLVTGAAVLTIVLAVAGLVAVFTLFDRVVLRSLPYRDADRLVAVWVDVTAIADEIPIQDPRREWTNVDTHRDLRSATNTLDDLAAFLSWAPSFRTDEGMERIPSAVVTWNALQVLGVTPIAGRLFTEDEGPPSDRCNVVISERFWRKHFAADPNVLGSELRLDEFCTVVGVVPATFRFPFLPYAAIFRAMRARGGARGDRNAAYIRQFGRLANGATLEQAQAELDTIAASLRTQFPAAYRGKELFVEPLQESLNRGVRNQVLLLQAATLFVFLIAIANLASVQVARVLARSTEFSVRGALGAGAWRQFRLLWLENLVLAMLGAIGGIALAFVGVDALTYALPSPAFSDTWGAHVDGLSIAVALAAAVLSATLMAAIACAVITRSVLPAGKAGGTAQIAGDRKARRVTGALVASNFAVAVPVAMTALLLLQSYQRLAAVDPGFARDGVVAGLIALPQTRYSDESALTAVYERLLAQLDQIPGTTVTALASAIPLGASNNDTFVSIEGQPTAREDGRAHTWLSRASDAYFEAMGVDIHRGGRGFEPADRLNGRRVAVVNQAFARQYLGSRPAIGVRVGLGPPEQLRWLDIVGVAEDVRAFDVSQPQTPTLYLPVWAEPDRGVYLVVRGSLDTGSMIQGMRRAVNAIDPELTLVDVRAMNERVDSQLGVPRTFSGLSLLLAFTALLLAAVGLYGTLAQSVIRRKRELGIRRALGAQNRHLLLQVILPGLTLVGIGFAAGVPLTMLLGRWLSTILYAVTLGELRTWAFAFGVLVLVASVAAVLPGVRAVRAPPMQALREG